MVNMPTSVLMVCLFIVINTSIKKNVSFLVKSEWMLKSNSFFKFLSLLTDDGIDPVNLLLSRYLNVKYVLKTPNI